MRIAHIRGQVTLSRSLPEFQGAILKIASVVSEKEIQQPEKTSTECENPIVMWDPQSASRGSIVAFSEGAEAARPLKPKVAPVDASVSAIIDEIDT